jgi:hypothetical protein
MQVVQFNINNEGFDIEEQPQEVWPFLESGRC